MCNNKICQVIIKQIFCQNGIPRTQYTVLSNLTNDTEISLNFGYTLIINSVTDSNITFILRDSVNSIPDQIINFNICCDTYRLLTLPAQNGTLRIYILAKCCCTCNSSGGNII